MGRPSSDPFFLPLLPPSVYLPPLPLFLERGPPHSTLRQGNLSCRFCFPRCHSSKCTPIRFCARAFKFAGCPAGSVGRSPCRELFFAWKKPGVLDAMEDLPPCGWPSSGQLRGPLLLFLFSWSVSQRSSTSWLLPEIVHLSSFPPFLKPLDLKESQCCRVGYRPLCVLRFGSVKAGMRLGANCNSGSCSCTSAFQKRVFTFCGWTGRFWHL